MSTVNKYNYEAILLDFAEGRLSATETDALFDFLATHPELQEDFDAAISFVSLKEDESLSFAAKNELLQDEQLDAKQDLIIAHLENAQTGAEKLAFEELLKNDESAVRELQVFSQLKLEADENVVFAKQEELIQTVSISYASWIYRATYAAAAVILLMLAFNSSKEVSGENASIMALSKVPRFEKPERPKLQEDLIPLYSNPNGVGEPQMLVHVPELKVENEQYASHEPLDRMIILDAREVELTSGLEFAELAEFIPENIETPADQDKIPSFVELVAQESKAFTVAYGFADALTSKVKKARKEYAENEYIEINFWKVHTQIRKPSWMRLNRR